MTLEEIENTIIERLEAELSVTDPNYSHDLLEVKVKSVLDEAQTIRGYTNYPQEFIEEDMTKGIPIFMRVSQYDYEKIGASGQTQYSADGENIQYQDRSKLWYGWIPLARIT